MATYDSFCSFSICSFNAVSCLLQLALNLDSWAFKFSFNATKAFNMESCFAFLLLFGTEEIAKERY